MQKDFYSSDLSILQSQFELKSLEFDQALKKDRELLELKKIFREMKELQKKITELRRGGRENQKGPESN
jgi:hypothetical protein